MTTKFFVIASPIGNLKDVSQRFLDSIKLCDIIFCEDTRETQKLLNFFKIKVQLESFHEQSKDSKIKKFEENLRNGKIIGYMVDAGTPCISDPGWKLVEYARNFGAEIEAIPGVSSITTFLSISGIPYSKFAFLGFLKKSNFAREILQTLEILPCVIFFENKFRIKKVLKEISEKSEKPLSFALGRELTKMNQEIISGNLQNFDFDKITTKGEFIIGIFLPKK
ncbi:MAG: 16S rRNA (cytidine(1402)-2'-O)-methyltransferase [Patescibacteria group bacterium]